MKLISYLAGLALLAVGAFALSGCSTPGSSSPLTADSERAMMKALKSYEVAWNRHDVAGVVAYFQPNGTYIHPGAGRLSGPALTAWLQGLFAAIPDFKVDGVSANPAGDRMIASQWVIKGTWTQPFPSGPLAGAKPTGKSFAVPGASFYEWKDGKFASETTYFDQLAFLSQIGAIGQK
jgi:steroid delta-isomerase-like uncharacterized protein